MRRTPFGIRPTPRPARLGFGIFETIPVKAASNTGEVALLVASG
jgi:hypothetical protein